MEGSIKTFFENDLIPVPVVPFIKCYIRHPVMYFYYVSYFMMCIIMYFTYDCGDIFLYE